MEQSKPDPDAANFRATIITSFLLGATMILLSLNVSIIKQSASVLEFGGWLLAVSGVLMLFSSMLMLFMAAIILQTVYLTPSTPTEKMQRVAWARTLLGVSSALIPTSFGSTFLVGLGVSTAWAWVFGAIGYGGGIVWVVARWYYLKTFVHPRQHEEQS